MIVRDRLVETELVKELPLTLVAPPHHRPSPSRIAPGKRNHASTRVFNRLLQHYLPLADIRAVSRTPIAAAPPHRPYGPSNQRSPSSGPWLAGKRVAGYYLHR